MAAWKVPGALRSSGETVLEERGLDSPAQRFGIVLVIENASDGAEERFVERVLIAAVIARCEVPANSLSPIPVYLLIQIVPHAPNDMLARNVSVRVSHHRR
jgi:hypothetical protein